MAAPSPFNRQTSFALFTAENPGKPHSGVDLDAEFNAVKVALDETQSNLGLIQDDDGELARGSVGRAQLASDVVLGVAPPELWAPDTDYVADVDVVFSTLKLYICKTTHTSGDTFDAKKWTLLADFSATAQIEDGSVDTDQLAAGAVTTAKIENNAVTTEKIISSAVTQSKIAQGAVSPDKMSDSATVSTRAAALLLRFADTVQAIQTFGYATVGDGGAASYKWVGSAPTHAGKFQSDDGAWWELTGPEVRPEMLGAAGDGTTNDATALTNADAVASAIARPLALAKSYKANSDPAFTTAPHFKRGGKIVPAASVAITFAKNFSTEDVHQQIFDLSASGSSVSAKIVTPYITPQMFGAAMDQTTDDSTAIAKALASLTQPGGRLLLPGMFKGRNISLPAGDYYTIEGTGPNAGIINDQATGDILSLTTGGDHITFKNFRLEIKSGVTASAGWGIKITGGALWPHIDNVLFLRTYGGVGIMETDSLNPVHDPIITNCVMRDIPFKGIQVISALATTIDNVLVSMVTSGGQVYLSSSRGVHIDGCAQDVVAKNVRVIGGERCWAIENTVPGAPAANDVRLEQIVADQGKLSSVLVNDVRRFRMINSSVSTQQTGAKGIQLTTNVGQAEIAHSEILNVATHGILVSSGVSNISILGNRVMSCSKDTNNTYDGINCAAGLSGLRISNNRCYNNPDFLGKQRYGIVVGSTTDNCIVTDNHLVGNQTAGFSNGTGTNCEVDGNIE